MSQLTRDGRWAARPSSFVGEDALMRAHRLLLSYPAVIRYRQPEEYALVRRHYDSLVRWHKERTGWRIYADLQGGVIRILKRHSSVPTGTWQPLKSEGITLQARDYALMVYVLWYARSPAMAGAGKRDVLLSTLQSYIAERSQTLAGVSKPLDFSSQRVDRVSLNRALLALQEMGALLIKEKGAVGPDGDETKREALVEFFDPVIVSTIVGLLPEVVAAASEIRPDPYSLTSPTIDPDASPLARAWRSLLLGPLLLKRDDPVAFRALEENQQLCEKEAAKLFNFALEITPHYARLARLSGAQPERGLSLLNYQQSGVGQAVLALCAALRRGVETGEFDRAEDDGCVILDHFRLVGLFTEVWSEYRRCWGSAWTSGNPEALLNARVYPEMRTAGLLRGPDLRNNVLITPAAACYGVRYQYLPDEGESGEPKSDESALPENSTQQLSFDT